MKRLLLLILTIGFGCNPDPIANSWNIDYPQEIEVQIEMFKKWAPPFTTSIPLKIVLTDNLYHKGLKISGLSSKSDRKIWLDSTSILYKESKTWLVMHELGHYVLKREHGVFNHNISVQKPWNAPISVMLTGETSIKDEIFLNDFKIEQYYMIELFNIK